MLSKHYLSFLFPSWDSSHITQTAVINNALKVKSLSPVRLLATPWTAAYQAPPSMGFSRQEYWSGVPLPSPAAAAAKLLQSCPTLRPHRRQPTRLPHPWDSPDKNTGVGCHFLLQCMKVKSVAQSCLTLSNPMDCSLPGSSVHGIFQAKILEWVAISNEWVNYWICSVIFRF